MNENLKRGERSPNERGALSVPIVSQSLVTQSHLSIKRKKHFGNLIDQ